MSIRDALIDVGALVACAVATFPSMTGVAVHEWLGVGLLVVFLAHAIGHYDELAVMVKGIVAFRSLRVVGRFAFNGIISLALTLCVVSGVFESGELLPAFGLYADGYGFWGPLHAFSAKLSISLVLVHLVMQGRKLKGCWGKRDVPV